MAQGQAVTQDRKEEARSKLSALYALTTQMARFGPTLAFRMSFFSVRTLPWGIGAAGAESVKEGVHSGNEEGKVLNQDTAVLIYLFFSLYQPVSS